MKFCEKCGTLYLESLPCCPKCNPALEEAMNQDNAPIADQKTIRKQWIAIIIAVPTLIGLTYLVGHIMQYLGTLS